MVSSQETGTKPKWWVQLDLYLQEDRSMKEDSLSRVVSLEVWGVAFNMLDLGPSIAETKG